MGEIEIEGIALEIGFPVLVINEGRLDAFFLAKVRKEQARAEGETLVFFFRVTIYPFLTVGIDSGICFSEQGFVFKRRDAEQEYSRGHGQSLP